MHSVLMVAEKPLLAKTIASALSDDKMKTFKGSNGVCPIHQWQGAFMSQTVLFKMTSVCGHVMSLDFTAAYNNWDQVDPAELFRAPTVKKEANAKLRMQSFLSTAAQGCKYLVLWLDCDKEGENICFEVIDAVKTHIRRTPHGQNIFRAWFSSITKEEILDAMQRLVLPNELLSLSVDARQELDLRIGCAFTRFQTKYFNGKYGDLDSNLISFGPCQTPTLAFCVERYDRIKCFKPEPYWSLNVECTLRNMATFYLDWARVRCFDKKLCDMFLSRIAHNSFATVVNCEAKRKSKQRPLPLNTVEMLRVASSKLSLGPQQTMTLAERLYTQGYISYPRTETTKYSAKFDVRGLLKYLQTRSNYGAEIIELLESGGPYTSTGGQDKGDHPPITPVPSPDNNWKTLESDCCRLYDYIVKHFIATVHRNCSYTAHQISFEVGDEKFLYCHSTVLDPGYTRILTSQSVAETGCCEQFTVGDTIPITQVHQTSHETSPPDYLSESDLITLMERHHIGTDASISVHINNIVQRNFVSLQPSSRKLVPTQLGVVLVHGYRKIDEELVLPTMRAEIEAQLDLIATGKVDFHKLIEHVVSIFSQKFRFFVENIDLMNQMLEVSFTVLAASGKPFSRCGKCMRYMRLIESRPARLHCSICNETLALPAGIFRNYNEQRCPLDGYELIQLCEGVARKSRSQLLCPYCHNHPPFEDALTATVHTCSECLNAACDYSQQNNGVALCWECDADRAGGEKNRRGGVLVLDVLSAPLWRITCTRCELTVNLFDHATRVSVLRSRCEHCASYRIRAEYQEKSRLPDGASSVAVCVFCDRSCQSLVRMHHAERSQGCVKLHRRQQRGRPSTHDRASRRQAGRNRFSK